MESKKLRRHGTSDVLGFQERPPLIFKHRRIFPNTVQMWNHNGFLYIVLVKSYIDTSIELGSEYII